MSFFGEQDGREWITLAAVMPPRRRRWSSAMLASGVLHAAMGALLLWPATRAVFVTPRLVAHGEGGNAAPVASVRLYAPADLHAVLVGRTAPLTLPKPANDQPSGTLRKRMNGLEVKQPSGERAPGSPAGTSYYGLTYGDEVKPALPVVFPDLRLSRSELPEGVQGDVIVEVTIDEQGSVIETRLLQGLGHGIDDRVIAVVRDWRFRPATRNGRPIASKHDVHFHFPS